VAESNASATNDPEANRRLLIATLPLGPVLGETEMSVGADRREAE
jgi:hypothetical protein